MVDRKQKMALVAVILIVGLSCVFMIDVVTLFPWEDPPSDFSWAVSEGDTFVLGLVGERIGDSSLYEIPSPLLPVLDSNILVTVSSLPNCSISSEDEFLSLVRTVKVSCTFENGSELSVETSSALQQIISRHVLPIGGWHYIDWLYADSLSDVNLPSDLVYEYYFASVENNHLKFRYYSSYADYREYWYGSSYLLSGIPFSIRTGESHGDDSWHVTLYEIQS